MSNITALTQTAIETANKAITERDRLQAINAELVAALQFMVDSDVNGWDVLPAGEKAIAALAKANQS